MHISGTNKTIILLVWKKRGMYNLGKPLIMSVRYETKSPNYVSEWGLEMGRYSSGI